MVASRRFEPKLVDMIAPYKAKAPTLSWACRDLKSRKSKKTFESGPVPSKKNKRRIEHLFKKNIHDLPDSMRPDCHRLKEHSYKSVYGRLRWDTPSQTITTGFGSMGQGRYVHPSLPRTITPHEAARLQFVPDFFRFNVEERTALAEMIGNGVPPKLTYILALELLR
jgi:DNA (cytosine-5)-methyltransferase 1